MKKDRICEYCGTLFSDTEGRVFSNHVRWCDKNTTNGDKGRKSISNAKIKYERECNGERTAFDVTCKKCNCTFIVFERKKRHPEKTIYYCSNSCSKSRGPMSESMKKLIADKLRKNVFPQRKTCLFCHNEFETLSKKKRFCSQKCGGRSRVKISTQSLQYFRFLCDFKFSLNSFPDEFDFSLIEKYGWYSAANRGNNLGGVSRDHLFSVKRAFELGVDPQIIAHPANCKLMRQPDNSSKYDKCDITLDELHERIKAWDEKYAVDGTHQQ